MDSFSCPLLLLFSSLLFSSLLLSSWLVPFGTLLFSRPRLLLFSPLLFSSSPLLSRFHSLTLFSASPYSLFSPPSLLASPRPLPSLSLSSSFSPFPVTRRYQRASSVAVSGRGQCARNAQQPLLRHVVAKGVPGAPAPRRPPAQLVGKAAGRPAQPAADEQAAEEEQRQRREAGATTHGFSKGRDDEEGKREERRVNECGWETGMQQAGAVGRRIGCVVYVVPLRNCGALKKRGRRQEDREEEGKEKKEREKRFVSLARFLFLSLTLSLSLPCSAICTSSLRPFVHRCSAATLSGMNGERITMPSRSLFFLSSFLLLSLCSLPLHLSTTLCCLCSGAWRLLLSLPWASYARVIR